MKTVLFTYFFLLSGLSFAQNNTTFEYSDLNFTTGQQKLIDVSYGMIDVLYSENNQPNDLIKLAKFLKKHPNLKIEIVRYSDSRGSAEMNLKLTQKQAKATKSYLVHHHSVNPNQVSTSGKGESNPIYAEKEINSYKETDQEKFNQMHAANRRTVIKITGIK